MKSALMFKIFTIIFILISISGYGQDFFDEMQIIDISKEADIRSSVIRDPQQALLIVKSHISGLRIKSNNVIIETKEVEPGRWHLKMNPGTHRLSFQAEGFISLQKRFYFNPKDTKGILIQVIPTTERKKEKNSGILVIKTQPEGAEVYLNDDFYGTTPYMGKLLAGRYDLMIKKEKFRMHKEELVIIPDETLPMTITMTTGSGLAEDSTAVKKIRIAILDFASRGISEAEVATLTDRFRNEIVKHGLLTVLNRGSMQEILTEIGFQQTGCTSNECAVEAGKILNVNKMVSGSIGKIGETYTIDVSLLDVETSKIEWSSVKDFRGERDKLLQTLKEIAQEMGTELSQEKQYKNLWWYIGGTVLAGGVIAAILLQDSPPKDEKIGNPPGEPIIP